MTQNAKTLGILMIVVALCVPALWAQRANPVGPAAPIGEDEESSSKQLDEPAKDAAKPDTRPLGGAETLSLGNLMEGRKYFRYNVNLSQRMESTSSSNIIGVSRLNGGFALQRQLPQSQLSLNYHVGGFFHTNRSDVASSYHSLSVRQSWQTGRWNFLVGDQLSYAPDSPYSLTMAGQFLNIAFNVNGQSAISPIFIPGQGILSGRTTRFGNTTVGQVQYRLGPRTSVFAAAGYGFLNFSGSAMTDFNQRNALVGFERQLNNTDSVGVRYGFSQFRFSNGASNVNNHYVHLAYGRRITSRIALEVSGGPELSFFRDPILGPTRGLYWSLGTSLSYRWGRSDLGLSYRHALNGGGGVLAGSEGDSVNLTWNRGLTRRWDMGMNLGYFRNRSIRTFSLSAPATSYDTQYASFGLSRKLSAGRAVYISYAATHQSSRGGQGFPLQHAVEVGFSWNPRPHRID
jgi:hypothetical protein